MNRPLLLPLLLAAVATGAFAQAPGAQAPGSTSTAGQTPAAPPKPATTGPFAPVAPGTATAPAAPARPPIPNVGDPAIHALIDNSLASGDDLTRRFYAIRKYQTAWSKADAQTLIAAINEADRHALNPQDYLPALDGVRDPADRDVRLTRAALAYAAALSGGRVDPQTVESIFTLRRNVVDVPGGLSEALKTRNLQPWLGGLAPQDKGYQDLAVAYHRYRRIAVKGGWPTFVPGVPMKPGDVDPRVPALVARLIAEGDLDAAAMQGVKPGSVQARTYAEPVVGAVKRFQVRHGLLDDGVIGDDTQDELAATAEDRARQIATNLERRRWLARTLASERIDVNTAASILVYWRNNAPVHGARVINGKSRTQTPSIEANFETVLANPPWYVPESIIRKEILPSEARNPGYLARENMVQLVDDNGGIRVVQKPGPGNSLGQVKFEVQDPYAIYLHDTPSKKLFGRYQRHLSHGCVRVENAVEFARLLLSDNTDALATFDAAEASGDTTRVQLGRSIPVRLLYWTAFMMGDGKVAFRKDVYGLDSKLGEALGVGALSFQPTDRDKTEDVGP